MAGGLELDDLSGPFQSKPFYDSMTLVVKMNTYLNLKQPSTLQMGIPPPSTHQISPHTGLSH